MKKVLLIFNILTTIAIFSASAADLNPFAYGLKSNTDNSMTLHIEFSINAKATSVVLEIFDVETEQTVFSVPCQAYNEKHDYSFDVDLSGIPAQYRGGNKNLNWRVNVVGVSNQTPQKVSDVRFYHPRSIDIDNNPENVNFGSVFIVEGLNTLHSSNTPAAKYASYLSYNCGAGLYVFNAAFENMPTINGDPGYNGGKTFTDGYWKGTMSYYSPNRVRVSDDGRIFISSCSPNSDGVLWEADKYIFCNPSLRADGWVASGWKKVMIGTRNSTTERIENDGVFVAAQNVSMDTKGSKDNLQLLLLSATTDAIKNFHTHDDDFVLSEYDLGENTTWSSAPSRKKNLQSQALAYNFIQIEYDTRGGYWMCQRREGDAYATLMHVNANGTMDLKEKQSFRGAGGIRLNKDGTKMIIAGKSSVSEISGTTSSDVAGVEGGYATLYSISYSNDGSPILSKDYVVDMSSYLGSRITDFAWDYANNLYAGCYNNERVVVYAMPYAGTVSTPASEDRYTFDIPCQSGVFYNVTIYSDPEEGGTVLIQGNNARASVESFESCTELTLTAVPQDGYKFVDWRDENGNLLSTNSVYTHLVADHITLYANFEYATYNVTWHNLLNNKNDLNASGDLDNLEELWYLITTYFNDYNVKNNNASGDKIRSRTKLSNGLSATQTFFAAGYVDTYIEGFLTNSTGKNYLTFTWLGDYINTVKSLTTSASGYYYWLTHFFAGYKEWYLYNTPSQWLPYYWRSVCGLPSQMVCNDKMPVEIKEISPKKSEITNSTVLSRTAYPSWYVRNHQEGKLLAWRDGSTTGDIVHHVSRSNMELHATYVDKRLQESDPTPDLSKDPYDATNNDVLSLLANDNYGTTVHNVTIDRKFVGGMYNTVCFPFDLPISKLPSELSGAEIRVFNGVTKTYDESGEPVAVLNFITLQEYWQDKTSYLKEPFLQAGMPYLIKPNADTQSEYLTYSLTQGLFFDGTRAPLDTVTNGITFQGVFNPTTITEENAYILVADNRLAKVTGANREIKGYRGYFVINDAALRQMAAEGRLYLSMKKPVTTSVPLAPEAEQQRKPEVRKIMYDGQIYILRGEEVYTITGHRVK